MKPWINELLRLIPIVLSTDTPWIMGVMLVVGLMLFLLVFCKLGSYLEFHQCDVFRAMAVLVVAIGLIAAAIIGARLYLEPRYGAWVLIAAAILGLLAAGLAPLAITRARFLRGVLALVIGLAAAAAVMALTRAALQAAVAGDRSVDRLRDRQEDTRGLLHD